MRTYSYTYPSKPLWVSIELGPVAAFSETTGRSVQEAVVTCHCLSFNLFWVNFYQKKRVQFLKKSTAKSMKW